MDELAILRNESNEQQMNADVEKLMKLGHSPSVGYFYLNTTGIRGRCYLSTISTDAHWLRGHTTAPCSIL
jgi:hypothetical protein